ncbi:Hypothetical predicted protein [Paramuricea clavata]|uniref:Uncharacterized protein n=1 Tax=Paramuricea clavata TaxID=317549 RepID=A0A7D9JP55_PARCT
MENIKRIFAFYAMIAFLLAYLTNLSGARPTNLSEENVGNGLQSNLNLNKQDVAAISEVCPPWIARLPGGCRRLLRLKRSISKRDFCPSSNPRCPRKKG